MMPLIEAPDRFASEEPIYAELRSPDRRVTSTYDDWERGGIAVGDSSQGLDVQNWTCWVQGVHVFAQYEGGTPELLFIGGGITEVSLTFDQAMRYCVAYMQNGIGHLRWYDTMVGEHVVSEFPGIRCPRVCLDDRRSSQLLNSDMILGYLRGDSLCFRQQRDRFEIEYVLRETVFPGAVLRNVGMNINWRLQFELAISVEAG